MFPLHKKINNLTEFYEAFCCVNEAYYKYELHLLRKDIKDQQEIKNVLKGYGVTIAGGGKSCVIEKVKGQINIRTSLTVQTIGIILWILDINKRKELKDFGPVLIDMKFRCKKRKSNIPVLSVAQKEGFPEEAFLPYYVSVPYFTDPFLFKDSTLQECIKKTREIGGTNHIYDKLFFRGFNNNKFRKRLFHLYKDDNFFDVKPSHRWPFENFVEFSDFPKYKYILDLYGGDGHSGRRFWLYHMNRVLFIPIDDPHKLFFEVWDNPPIPDEHFVPYFTNNLGELKEKVEWLEANPEEYKRIKNNCFQYSREHLSYNKLEKFIENELIDKGD